MRLTTVLHSVMGENIAHELHEYGSLVICVDPSVPAAEMFVEDRQRFIDRHLVDRDTPFVRFQHGTLMRAIVDRDVTTWSETDDIMTTGWRCMPGAQIEFSQVHDLMVKRLNAGLPVTLIPQTANAFRLEKEDLAAIDLAERERSLLIRTVKQQRNAESKPVLIIGAFAEGKRCRSRWYPSLALLKVAHRFASIDRDALRWPNQR